MKQSEIIHYASDEEPGTREEVFIVLHNHTVWKGMFFKSQDQAFNVIKMFHKHELFDKNGKVLTGKKTGNRFTVYTVKEYLKMDDLKYVHEW